MKYIILVGDGMADEPLDQLDGKTPLEYAHTPYMDVLAGKGEVGLVSNVPFGMKPGSDIANLSVLGYDPRSVYSGRSPLEALSVGVSMKDTDVVFRCNLVTLSEDEPYCDKRILDHSSSEISTEDANVLMDAIRESFDNDSFRFYTGTSYRHICVWNCGTVIDLEPPHDHLTDVIHDYLPRNPELLQMMMKSYEILNDHPINVDRAKKGLHKANSLWFWGAGTKPALESFFSKTGLNGAMISAVDLLKGIAVGSGMSVIPVPGATGSIDTNYQGKANAALNAILEQGHNFVFVHLEAPDEMGHQGDLNNKIRSIEDFDSKVIGPIVEKLNSVQAPYRMLILPDHPTPIKYRTHTADPVPYLLYDSTMEKKRIGFYNEKEAKISGLYEPDGYKLIQKLTNNGGS